MGTKDTASKAYLKDERRFADLFNFYLYGGEQRIKPEDLQERDSTEVLSFFGTGEKEIREQRWRDLLKRAVVKTNGQVMYILLGVEPQTNVHYAAPVRDMLYDALNYAAQVQEAGRRHRRKKEYGGADDFLSGFHKGDRLTPVITLLLYLGNKEWDGARTLHELFGENVDERLRSFIPDYRLNLIVPKEIADFTAFQTPLGALLHFIQASDDKRKIRQLLQDEKIFSHLENETVAAINTFANTKIKIEPEGGVTDVCKAWDDSMEDSRNEGIEIGRRAGWEEGKEEGREEGREEGISALAGLIKKGFITIQQAADEISLSSEEFASLCRKYHLEV